ncbi:hypothetical protein [Mesorhizobium sp. M7A.F.Ca.US.008.03.1.1]|uniref:hypothetical protein n=1 Tax=Mesorhizobium sp. M7A.F.Ca.US.008.03.1.1 TaxID=2496742 RepID=UPI0019D129A7|nr:hypothetical protein [Mesorhizobium sp. M7A.F.Ca.US.008.03.1.1]
MFSKIFVKRVFVPILQAGKVVGRAPAVDVGAPLWDRPAAEAALAACPRLKQYI